MQCLVYELNTSEITGEKMLLENKNCHIEVKIDETYMVDSTDNRYYDVTLNPGHFSHNDLSKTLSIRVSLFASEFTIALIGSFYTYDSDCAVLDENTLTVLQGGTITQLNVIDGSIIRYIQLDCFECNFAIYKVMQGYIIYGEIEITMLNLDFVKKWSFSGKDIFVTTSGKNPFELHEDSISLYDFEDNHYVIDFEGNLIN